MNHIGYHHPDSIARVSRIHHSFAMLVADLVYNQVRSSPDWPRIETAPGEMLRSGGAGCEVFSWSK